MRPTSRLLVAATVAASLAVSGGTEVPAQPAPVMAQSQAPVVPFRVVGQTLWIGDASIPLPVALLGSLGFIGALMAAGIGLRETGSSATGSGSSGWGEGDEPTPLTTTVTETQAAVTLPRETVTVTETPEPVTMTATTAVTLPRGTVTVTETPEPVTQTETVTATATATETTTAAPLTVTQTLNPVTVTATATVVETTTTTAAPTTAYTTVTTTAEVEIPNVIPDIKLRELINARLGRNTDLQQDISARELANLKHLDVSSASGVQSFEGLQFASGLSTMHLTGLTQLPDMSGMTELRQLWIWDYQGSDLIQRLNVLDKSNLWKFDLTDSTVNGDLGPTLAGMPQLQYLALYRTGLTAVPEEMLGLSSLIRLGIIAGNPGINPDDPILQQLRDRIPDPVQID